MIHAFKTLQGLITKIFHGKTRAIPDIKCKNSLLDNVFFHTALVKERFMKLPQNRAIRCSFENNMPHPSNDDFGVFL